MGEDEVNREWASGESAARERTAAGRGSLALPKIGGAAELVGGPPLPSHALGAHSDSPRETPPFSVGSGAADVVGKGLIVHKDPDDYKTQPTGNSGARIACGVIKAS